MQNNVRLILASSSPRRRELLAAAGYDFTVEPPDESAESAAAADETPRELVLRNAREKGMNVAARLRNRSTITQTPDPLSVRSVIVACDTVAVCDGVILGKPQDRADAERMLRRLAGSEHEVFSGLFLLSDDDYGMFDGPENLSFVRTALFMEPLSDEKITDYLDSDAWRGKAGAFGYQDGNDWVHILDGSESNVVGLPMERLAQALEELGN